MTKKKIILALFIIAILGLIFYFKPVPKPEWSKNLSPKISEARIEIDTNLQNKFPLGTPIKDFIDHLQKYNFKPSWHLSDNKQKAFLAYSSLVCSITIEVIWEADTEGNLSFLKGDRRTVCL